MKKEKIIKLEVYLLILLCFFCRHIDCNAQIIPGGIRIYSNKDTINNSIITLFQPMVDTMSVEFGWDVIVNYTYNRIDIVPEDTAGIVALFILELKEFAGITENEVHELSDSILKKLRERCNSKTDQQRKPYPAYGWDFFLYEKSIFQILWENFSTEDLASFLCSFDYLNWRQNKEYHLSDTMTVLNLFVDELEKGVAEKMSQLDRNRLIALIQNHLIGDKQISGVFQPGKLDGPAFLLPLISFQKFRRQMTGEQYEELWESFPSASDMDIFGCLEPVLTKEQLIAFYLSEEEYSIRYQAAFYVVGRTYNDYQEFLSDIRKRVRGK